jgi:D-glycero-D-manno-heptose 1,7-bisphosphate phosphatase
MQQKRFVILDRDGVINEDSDSFIKSPEEWRPIPGSLEAIALLNRHGYEVVVITNQSGIARELFDRTTLEKIHAKMRSLVAQQGGRIAAIYVCPHGPADHCACRKPKPGLLEQFAQEQKVRLNNIPLIGDAQRDIDAALAVGASPILVRTGKGEKTLAAHPHLTIPIFKDLYDATRSIVEE